MTAFDRYPTPPPPPPRDPGDSGNWRDAVAELRQSHRDLGERFGGNIEALDERLGEVRDGAIVAHGLDGRNGKLHAVEKRLDGSRALLIALICASLGGLGTAATGWLAMRDRLTRVETRVESSAPVIDAFARHLTAPALVPSQLLPGGIP